MNDPFAVTLTYRENGLDGLIDKWLNQTSARKAPVDEVMTLVDLYRKRHKGWNVSRFHDWYQQDGSTRSYTWFKNILQEKNLVKKAHKECMCESMSLFARFTESANELLKMHSVLEGQGLFNFKKPSGVPGNLSLEGIKKQAAMEFSCD